MRQLAGCLLLLALSSAGGFAHAQQEYTPPPAPTQPDSAAAPPAAASQVESGPPAPAPWLDRLHHGTYDIVWRSAMRIDRLFGSRYDERAYQQITGSVAPAVLWDEFGSYDMRFRFNINLPLPRMNERFNAFVGRVDPEEYISERSQQSGAFRRQYGPRSTDETLLGLSYIEPRKQGIRFDAGTGIRLRSSPDPYVKGGIVYEKGSMEGLMFGWRETAFWQPSEGAGFTTRFDLDRYMEHSWLVRWTTSGTFSQQSNGLKGYSSLMALHGLSDRRAVAFAVGLDGETDADVPLRDYGMKVAYRQQISRDWLVMEIRTSLTWPREELTQSRPPSWGVGIGFEMLFGTDEFLARPVTF
jgi:hypothetical protein